MELLNFYWDTEANGLEHEDSEGNPPADKFWCINLEDDNGVTYDFILDGYEEGDVKPVSLFAETMEEVFRKLNGEGIIPVLIASNQYGYDLPMLNKLLGIHYSFTSFISPDIRVGYKDTLDLSQSLWPDRPMPKGCPHVIPNPVTGKNKKVGPHGLESWGYRVANAKPSVHDWRNGEPAFYMHRCKEDRKITKLTYLALMQEMNNNRMSN